MKWSVIIPTLWKSGLTRHLLMDLDECDLVGEVILIDNNPESRIQLPPMKKIKFYVQDVNIFVNPAWNLGVTLAKFENICICNDDLNFNSNILFNEISKINLKNTFIGCHYNCFLNKPGLSFEIFNGHSIGKGWGCMLFFSKKNFPIIPSSLKIYFGDDWIALKALNIKSFIFPILTQMSTSSSSREFTDKIKYDYLQFESLLNIFEKRFIYSSHVDIYSRRNRLFYMILIQLNSILTKLSFNKTKKRK